MASNLVMKRDKSQVWVILYADTWAAEQVQHECRPIQGLTKMPFGLVLVITKTLQQHS